MKRPLVSFDAPAEPDLLLVMSPKSVALPVDAMVILFISFTLPMFDWAKYITPLVLEETEEPCELILV